MKGFNSQICTTRSQSEALLKLGLKKETADMVHTYLNRWDGYHIHEHDWSDISCDEQHIPAWSLHRLIEMMPWTLIEDRVYHERWNFNLTRSAVIYRNEYKEDEWIGECFGQGMYNNIIDCIEWLIKEGYFNKEYLN